MKYLPIFNLLVDIFTSNSCRIIVQYFLSQSYMGLPGALAGSVMQVVSESSELTVHV